MVEHPNPSTAGDVSSSLTPPNSRSSVNVTLKPCPWCGKTPVLDMPIDEREYESWRWSIYCGNYDCPFAPRGRHVTIRKSQKLSLVKIQVKLERLALFWNSLDSSGYEAYETLHVVLDKFYEYCANKEN